MTSNSASKQAIRAYMAAHNISYSEAKRHLELQQNLPEAERLAFFSAFIAGEHPHSLLVSGLFDGRGATTLHERLVNRVQDRDQASQFSILDHPVADGEMPEVARPPFLTRVLVIHPRKEDAVLTRRLAQDPTARYYVIANRREGEPRFSDSALSEYFAGQPHMRYLGSADLSDTADGVALLDQLLDLTARQIEIADRSLIRMNMPTEASTWDSAQRDGNATLEASPYPVLLVGQRLRFTSDIYTWKVRRISADGRYAVLTCGKSYSIIDFQAGIRGPDNSYGTGYSTDAEIAESLEKLVSGETQLSVRHWAWLNWADKQPDSATTEMLGELRTWAQQVYLANPDRRNAIFRNPPPLAGTGRLPHSKPYDSQLRPMTGWAIGSGADDSVVSWTPADAAHLLVTGATGKSTAMRAVLTSALIAGAQAYVIDGADAQLAFARRRTHTYAGPPTYRVPVNSERALEIIDLVRQEVNRRYERMASLGIDHWTELEGPPLVLVIDDYDQLVTSPGRRGAPQATANLVEDLAYRGWAAEVHVVLSTAHPGLPASLLDNLPAWLLTGADEDPMRRQPVTAPCGPGRAWLRIRQSKLAEVQVWTGENDRLQAAIRKPRDR
jgi:hypothetical protein